jgi:small-conductance mechanosensitive channel
MKKRGLIINTVYFLFIAMFTYAAVSKWLVFNVFISQINKQPFNDKLTPLLVWGIPTSEIIVSLMMMIDKTRELALKIATAMMILFTGYIILIELNLFGKIPCACGGAISELSWTQHLFFNLFFVFAGLLAIFLIRKNKYSTE